MMRYPWIHIILFAGFIVFVLLGIRSSFWLVIFACWIAFSLAILIWGSSSVCSGMYIKVICRVNTDEKKMTITFDDGPHPVYTIAVLDTLRQNNIKAVFFVKGREVAKHPDIIQRMDEEGHVIANHSWSHSHWFDLFPYARMRQELENTNLIIHNAIGKTPRFFRPPYGVTNPPLAKTIKKLNLTTIGWSIRSMDTVGKDPEKLVSRIKNKMVPGSILLLHDNLSQAEDILGRILDMGNENGYKFVPLDELLNIKAYDSN